MRYKYYPIAFFLLALLGGLAVANANEVIMGQYSATPSTLTDKQIAPFQLDVDGTLTARDPIITNACAITTQNLNPTGVATAGSTCELGLNSHSAVTVQVTGTWTGSLQLQGTLDGTTWVAFTGGSTFISISGTYSSAIGTGLQSVWQAQVGGYTRVRISASAAITGTANITLNVASSATVTSLFGSPTVQGTTGENSAATGNPVRTGGWDGTNIRTLKTNTTGNIVTSSEMTGVAPGTAPSGAAITGGVYNATPPTFTNGQTGALQLDSDGSLYVNVRDATVAATSVHYLSAATTNSTNVKATPGIVYQIHAGNTTAGAYYLKIYDKATAPTCGTDTPIQTYVVPPAANGGALTLPNIYGMNFAAGIGFCLTGAITDADTTATTANSAVIDIIYK